MKIAIIFLIQALACISYAQSMQVEFMRSFQSEQVLFPGPSSEYSHPTPGQDPNWMRWLFQDLLSWNPSGKPVFYTPACLPTLWAEKLYKKKVSEQGRIINEYLKKCQTEVETGVQKAWIHTLKIMSVKLEIQDHPLIHRVVFQLPNGDRVKGRLALKGDLKKRPLVIFRLGVFANAEEFKPERFIFMMLFEQTPFNVLILENNSGPDALFYNKRKSFGGFDEGLQNTWIARQLTDPKEPLSQIISSIHLVGMSLGGHGVFYSSLLNEFNSNSKGEKLFSSFLGFCPVVHLQNSLEQLMQDNLMGMIVEFWSRFRLQTLRKQDPKLNEWDFANWLKFKPHFLRNVVDTIARDFRLEDLKKLNVKLPPQQRKTNTYWDLENFWPAYDQVKSPVMIWATEHDSLTPLNSNSQTLHEKNISLVKFAQGFHCTLPVGYDWSALSSFLTAYILANDRSDFALKSEYLKMDVSRTYDRLAKGWSIEHVEWLANDPENINLRLHNQQHLDQTVNALLPLDLLDFRLRNPQISSPEKYMLERWIYQNIRIINRPRDTALWLHWKRAL